MALTFKALRKANLERLPTFRDKKGRLCHHGDPPGFDWSLSQWSNAVCGELGEVANVIKKIERGDFTLDEKRQELADELCDVATYLDLLAHRASVDLDEAILKKWNEVSERVSSSVRLNVSKPKAHPEAALRADFKEAKRLLIQARELLRSVETVLKWPGLTVGDSSSHEEKLRRYHTSTADDALDRIRAFLKSQIVSDLDAFLIRTTKPRFVVGDRVVLDPNSKNFPAFGKGPWEVEAVAKSDGEGFVVTLKGFNTFHESWFVLEGS